MKKIICMIVCALGMSAWGYGEASNAKWESVGDVKVDGGVIELAGKGARTVLELGKKSDAFKNFELQVNIKTAGGGKGYLAFHTDDSLVKGYKIAIDNDVEFPIWWRMTGSILGVRNIAKSIVPDGDWFALKLEVLGANIKVFVNGTLVADYIEPAKPYRIRGEGDAILSEGTFAFVNAGGGEIFLKNLRIKKLPDAVDIKAQQANAADEQNDDIIKLHQADFPVLDYHVHLKGDLTEALAAEQSRKYGINYAIAPNCGKDFPIKNDAQVIDYLNTHRSMPFILAMQAEGREWVDTFSPEVRAEFDYVFTDAMTFTDPNGRRVHLWKPEEVEITDEQAYMDIIVSVMCGVMGEPADVNANSLYLPDVLQPKAAQLWTAERRAKVLEALVKGGMALEISNLYKTPDAEFIKAAKARGVKFTFGSNNSNSDFGKLEYPIKMIKECGLTPQDMYKPKIKIK